MIDCAMNALKGTWVAQDSNNGIQKHPPNPVSFVKSAKLFQPKKPITIEE
jgi:hypothetical protein